MEKTSSKRDKVSAEVKAAQMDNTAGKSTNSDKPAAAVAEKKGRRRRTNASKKGAVAQKLRKVSTSSAVEKRNEDAKDQATEGPNNDKVIQAEKESTLENDQVAEQAETKRSTSLPKKSTYDDELDDAQSEMSDISSFTDADSPSDPEDETEDKTETSEGIEVIDLVKPRLNRCLNTNCAEKCGEHTFAPEFCFTYFKVKKSKSKNQDQEICMNCYNQCIITYDKLATALKKGEGLCNVDVPIINETVQIDDSDEENEPEHAEEYLDDANIAFINDNIDDVMNQVVIPLNISSQMENYQNVLQNRVQNELKDIEKLKNEVERLQESSDNIQRNLYKVFAPNRQQLEEITIIDDYTVSDAMQVIPGGISSESPT